MQHFTLYTFSIALFFGLGCHAVTYHIDESCHERFPRVVEGIMEEAIDMAKKGKEQLSGSDTSVLSATFEQIFSTNAASSKTDVSNIFGKIAGMAPTDSFDASDVRLYCDDDESSGDNARWRLLPDYPKHETPNSKLPADQQHWWDIDNYVTRAPGGYGCKYPGTLAETYKNKINIKKAQKQNPNREVITICDETLKARRKTLKSIKRKDLDRPNMDKWSSLSSVTMMHELTHLDSIAAMPGEPDPVTWAAIVNLDSAASLQAADCYAYLGLCALLAERGFRLSDDAQAAHVGKVIPIQPNTAQNPGAKSKRGNSLTPSPLEAVRSKMWTWRRGLEGGRSFGGGSIIAGAAGMQASHHHWDRCSEGEC